MRRYRIAALAALLAGCSSAPPPQAPPPATPEPGATARQEAAEAPPEAPEAAAATAPRSPPEPTGVQLVTIEPAEPAPGEPPTLAEAARRERERRRESDQPIAVITDSNLAEHATGVLTFVEEDEQPAEPQADGEDPAAAAAEAGRGEAYWRERVRTLRERWAEAAARVPELEEEAAELRRRFYETDDGFYRDSRIKPAWDRTIDQVARTRAQVEAYRRELEQVLDEGRRAGALPGWLREGVELEPPPPEPVSDTHEPGEPVIVDEGGG